MTGPSVDIIGEIGRLLEDVQPSPAFAAGVRARVESEEPKRAPWFGWRNVLAGMAICGCAATAATLTHRHVLPRPTFWATDVRPATSAVERPADAGESRREPAHRVRVPVRVSRVASVEEDAPLVAARLGDHEVIVPADQRAALARLLSGVHARSVLGRATLAPAYDRDGLLLPPPPVVVALLPALAPDDPDVDGETGRSVGSRGDRIRKDKR